MPSFDIVSEINQVELRNAVAQTNKEVDNRFDFKGSDARVEIGEKLLTVFADDDFKLDQVFDILTAKFAKRGVDVRCMDRQPSQKIGGNQVKQEIRLKIGIESELAKKIVKQLKESRLKVQANIQGDSVRVSGAKRDLLQEAIALVRKAVTDVPLQFNNFRD